jgi:hypothetical protein
MTFNESAIRRDTTGRFSEKTGSATEVSLSEPLRAVDGSRPQAPEASLGSKLRRPLGYEKDAESYPVPVLYRKSGMSERDVARVEDFVERTGFTVFIRPTGHATEDGAFYKAKYGFADGRILKAGTVEGHHGSRYTLYNLIYNARKARDFPESRRYYEDRDKLAREVFGADYDAIVSPPAPSLGDRLRGR